MVIVLISSALVVFSFAREKIDSPVVVLKNIYPEKIYSQASVTTRERMDFSFSLAARRGIKTLEIQYVTLVQTDPIYIDKNLSEVVASLGQVCRNIAPIVALIEETENDYIGHDVLPVEGGLKNLSYMGLFYDFPIVRLYSDPTLSGQIYTSFLVIDNGTDILYFEGISDFFLNRLGGFVDLHLPEGDEMKSAIASLRIRRNNNATSYSSAADAPDDWRTMEDTPNFGRVIFSNAEKHDTFSIDFSIETPRRPQKMSAHVIRVYADGELVETVLNLME